MRRPALRTTFTLAATLGWLALAAADAGSGPAAVGACDRVARPEGRPSVAESSAPGGTDAAADPRVAELLEKCDAERVSRRYSRLSPRTWSGRFGGSCSLTARSGCGGSSARFAQLSVCFEDGRPVCGAELRDHRGDPVGTTDGAGLLRRPNGRLLSRRAADGTWTLDGRRLYRKSWLEGPPGCDPFVVLWSAGRAIEGRVVDRFGGPVADATVTLQGEVAHKVKSDADGRFRVADCTPSPMPRPALTHPDCFKEPMMEGVPEGAPRQTTELSVVALRGRHHSLTVTNVDREPLPNAEVTWTVRWPAAVDVQERTWRYRTQAGDDGVAALLLVPGAELEATIKHWGFTDRGILGLAARLPEQLTVDLRDSRALTWIPLHCRDARTGAAVKPTRVLVRRAEQPWIVGEPVGSVRDALCHPHDGADFALHDLDDMPEGVWEIWTWAPGYHPRITVATATAGGVYPPPDVRMRPGVRVLRVRVVARDGGAPPVTATVRVRVAGRPDPFVHAARFGAEQTVATAESCAFALPPGDYEVTAEAAGHEGVSRRVTVGPHEQTIELGF